VSSEERNDDEEVTHRDDDERQDADERKRQPRPHVLLEVRVRLRTTTHLNSAGLSHRDTSRPEHVEVLADGDEEDDDTDPGSASRRTDDVLDERQSDSDDTVDGERHEDPDCRVTRRVERELLHLARPSTHSHQLTNIFQPACVLQLLFL